MAQPASKKETQAKNLKYLRDKDREMVKGIFRFHEVPGGTMGFVFRAYIEDEVERCDRVDGEVYTIPLGVARHLNKNGWYPEYEYVPGSDMRAATGITLSLFYGSTFLVARYSVSFTSPTGITWAQVLSNGPGEIGIEKASKKVVSISK